MDRVDALAALERAKKEIEDVQEWAMVKEFHEPHPFLMGAGTQVSSAVYMIRTSMMGNDNHG